MLTYDRPEVRTYLLELLHENATDPRDPLDSKTVVAFLEARKSHPVYLDLYAIFCTREPLSGFHSQIKAELFRRMGEASFQQGNQKEGFDFYQKAIDLGSVDALGARADIYHHGYNVFGLGMDPQKALRDYDALKSQYSVQDFEAATKSASISDSRLLIYGKNIADAKVQLSFFNALTAFREATSSSRNKALKKAGNAMYEHMMAEAKQFFASSDHRPGAIIKLHSLFESELIYQFSNLPDDPKIVAAMEEIVRCLRKSFPMPQAERKTKKAVTESSTKSLQTPPSKQPALTYDFPENKKYFLDSLKRKFATLQESLWQSSADDPEWKITEKKEFSDLRDLVLAHEPSIEEIMSALVRLKVKGDFSTIYNAFFSTDKAVDMVTFGITIEDEYITMRAAILFAAGQDAFKQGKLTTGFRCYQQAIDLGSLDALRARAEVYQYGYNVFGRGMNAAKALKDYGELSQRLPKEHIPIQTYYEKLVLQDQFFKQLKKIKEATTRSRNTEIKTYGKAFYEAMNDEAQFFFHQRYLKPRDVEKFKSRFDREYHDASRVFAKQVGLSDLLRPLAGIVTFLVTLPISVVAVCSSSAAREWYHGTFFDGSSAHKLAGFGKRFSELNQSMLLHEWFDSMFDRAKRLQHDGTATGVGEALHIYTKMIQRGNKEVSDDPWFKKAQLQQSMNDLLNNVLSLTIKRTSLTMNDKLRSPRFARKMITERRAGVSRISTTTHLITKEGEVFSNQTLQKMEQYLLLRERVSGTVKKMSELLKNYCNCYKPTFKDYEAFSKNFNTQIQALKDWLNGVGKEGKGLVLLFEKEILTPLERKMENMAPVADTLVPRNP